MPPEVNLTALRAGLLACFASFIAIFWLFQKHIAGQKLLPYELRRPVPWGGFIALLAVLIPVANVLGTLWEMRSDPSERSVLEEVVDPDGVDSQSEETSDVELVENESSKKIEPSQFVANALLTTLVMLSFVVLAMGFLQWTYHADGHDLGLPISLPQWVRDTGIGSLAALAAILPIYVVQVFMVLIFQPETQHPLIEQLMEQYTSGMLVAGFITAVVAAPIFEEFSFRVLLQGWLEKVEDQCVDHRASLRSLSSTMDKFPSTSEFEKFDVGGEVIGHSTAPESEVEPERHHFSQSEAVTSPQGMLACLPHGWLPILVSGTLFGFAHLGQGVAPIPLVLFGIVLGYLYQRTHRLAPCIAAHAVFNAFSMGMLWLHLE